MGRHGLAWICLAILHLWLVLRPTFHESNAEKIRSLAEEPISVQSLLNAHAAISLRRHQLLACEEINAAHGGYGFACVRDLRRKFLRDIYQDRKLFDFSAINLKHAHSIPLQR